FDGRPWRTRDFRRLYPEADQPARVGASSAGIPWFSLAEAQRPARHATDRTLRRKHLRPNGDRHLSTMAILLARSIASEKTLNCVGQAREVEGAKLERRQYGRAT